MPKKNDALKHQLEEASEINITVTGRKSGRSISRPVWFVWQDGTLYLLPVKGSETQWYKNVLQNPSLQIEAGGTKAEVQAAPVTGKTEVSDVVAKFRAKYAGDVKKYYSKFDAAVVAKID